MYERVGEKHLSRREFLVRRAAFGVATTGLGSLISACGYGGAAGSGADRPVTMPIHTGPWLPSYQAMVKLYEKETGNRVELVPYPLQQVLSKQLIDSDAALAATGQWLELASLGLPEAGSVTQGTIIGLMQTGEALHTHIAAAAILPFDDPEQSSLPGKISASVVPRPEGGQHAPTSGIWINAIPAHISYERKQAAYRFIRWLMEERVQTEYARSHGIVTHGAVYGSEMVEDDHDMRALRAIYDSVPYVRKGMDYVIGVDVSTILDLRLNQIVSGVLEPREGHKLMAEDLKKLVGKSDVV